MTAILFIAALIVLALIAPYWGTDSSSEADRAQQADRDKLWSRRL